VSRHSLFDYRNALKDGISFLHTPMWFDLPSH